EGAKVKSIRIHQYGGPEVMQIDELQTPTPAENQALVRVEAAGVNFMDIYQRSGTYQLSLPAALGAEGAGTIEAVGYAVRELADDAGADEVILYTEQDLESETKRLTGGQGVTVVYDSVGRDTFDKSLNCLRRRGYLVLYGASSGPVPPLNPQTLAAKGSVWL